MKKLFVMLSASALTIAFSSNAYATSPNVYVVNFTTDQDVKSQQLDQELSSALKIVGTGVEQIVIDTSNAAIWEKSAHEAFDRDIVPVFNKWVGLTGFAAIVNAKTKKVMGCVDNNFTSTEIAEQLREMSNKASGSAYMKKASTGNKSTQCPSAYNKDPGY